MIDTIAAHTYTTYGERLLAAVREAGGDLTVTASVGIAWMPLLRFALAEPVRRSTACACGPTRRCMRPSGPAATACGSPTTTHRG